jgi:hypothetical protein
MAGYHKIGDDRQSLTDRGNHHKSNQHAKYDYKVGDKVLVEKEGILYKAKSKYGKEPWHGRGFAHKNLIREKLSPQNPKNWSGHCC